MSLFLYRLGRIVARHRGLVVGLWVLALVGLGGGSAMLGDKYDDSFSIPGTDSQEGQDLLAERFGLTGASGQVLFSARSGKITDQANAAEVASLVKAIDAVDGVSINDPLSAATPTLNTGSTATLAQISFADQVPTEDTLDEVLAAGTTGPQDPVTASIGGDAYKSSADPSKVPEMLGLLVSFLILVLTFRSLVAAGMPILTALVGVGVTITSVIVVSNLVTVSSTAPTLAEMLGLAVGIDYALFILSRHRARLAEGLDVVESMSRALATAGSAVVFAGTTVIIALAGLSVANIPVLTVMGLGAAFSVTVAVSVALTLLPAIALLLGERLRPKPRKARRDRRVATADVEATAPSLRPTVAVKWVAAATRHPVLTVVAVVALLGLATVPAFDMKLGLPDNSTAPTDTPQRQTYDAITATFGEGYNAPLIVTADIITSTSPQDTVSQLADGIRKLPGVVAVPQETPDEGADTGLVQVIPAGGQNSTATSDLVRELRAQTPALEEEYGVSTILVTGQTAANIDASDRLGEALLPFAAIVIGLSLILLTIVFRSIAVPIKATLGYLLSVGAALGAVVVVFQWGWADAIVPGLADAPIVSFLPIFVMGVLFGLAMDYEMFLVSAMREHYVVSGVPREAVKEGFRASARVVTAAALIMTSVFIAFVPGGSSTIQQIAFGLAVGVSVDAFLVRMTLVPAVLVLLDHRAWWLSETLQRLPEVDVEGAALHRKIAFEGYQASHGQTTLLAQDLVVRDGAAPAEVSAVAGEVTHVAVPDADDARALARVLSARRTPSSGELVVDGLLVPEQREAVVRRTALLELTSPDRSEGSVEDRVHDRVRLEAMSGRKRRALTEQALGLVQELAAVATPQGAEGSVASAVVEAALGLGNGADVFVLSGLEDQPEADRRAAERLAEELARRGATVLVVASPSRTPATVSAARTPHE